MGDEVVTYEDVVRMDPNIHWRRPIVLIGRLHTVAQLSGSSLNQVFGSTTSN